MNSIRLALLILSMYSLYGCTAFSTADSLPAVIPQHTDESIAEIRSIVNQTFNGNQVTIAKTVFNKNNRLILERKKLIGPDGKVIQTRVDQEPVIIELSILGKNCYLTFLKTNKQHQLKHAPCIIFSHL
ncbi:MAG: hypothetical protein COA74_00015 [Gammaproteobacteria bacterium]|nr:MAG: hypothetical protein COA74_00015 [Gammaproteobacteria bacterium]